MRVRVVEAVWVTVATALMRSELMVVALMFAEGFAAMVMLSVATTAVRGLTE